ncbi:MAG: hypothetical protein AAFP20_16620, partial [Cyanobacteria bacterium J06614_10]
MNHTAIVKRTLAFACAAFAVGICQPQLARNEDLKNSEQVIANKPMTSLELTVLPLPLSGPLAHRDAEISGLAWYEDYLILLPQYPSRLDNHLFALRREDIVRAVMEAGAEPLNPLAIPLDAPDFE